MNLRNLLGVLFVLCTVATTAAMGQGFNQISQNGITASQVVAGGVKIFITGGPYAEVYQYSPSYDAFVYTGGNPSEAHYMGVGGGNVFQSDDTWVEDYEGYLWHLNISTEAWDLALADNRVQAVTVGPGYSDDCHPYETWLLLHDASAGWFPERYNYCTKIFDGIGTSASPTGLSRISTGGGEVWALNTANQIFRFNPATGAFAQMTGTLAQIAVGVDGVWGLNANGSFFEFNPISQVFNAVSSNKFSSIAAGGNGVWGLIGGVPYRYIASTRTWVQVGGSSFTSLFSGTGAGVFGLKASTGVVYAFY